MRSLLLLLCAATAHAASLVGSTPIGPFRIRALETLVSEDGTHFAELIETEGRDAWYVDGRTYARERKGAFAYAKDRLGRAAVEAVLGSDGRLAYARRVYDETGAPIGLAVVIGGVRGPTYNAIAELSASPSGAHFAYLGQEGVWHVVVDGSVVATHTRMPKSLAVDDAGRVVYLAPRDGDGAQFMFLNGKPLRPWAAEELVLAPGWRSIAGRAKREYQYVVAVEDDRAYGPYTSASNVRFSADGRSVFYEADSAEGDKVFRDGKPYGPGGFNAVKEGAPIAPSRFAWFAPHGSGKALFVDGRPTVELETAASVGASPGGEHYAAVGWAKSGTVWAADGVVTDVKESIFGGTKIVFDTADEYHALILKDGIVQLACLSFSRRSVDGSTCMARAKRRYKTFDEDDPDFDGTGLVRRAKVKRR